MTVSDEQIPNSANMSQHRCILVASQSNIASKTSIVKAKRDVG